MSPKELAREIETVVFALISTAEPDSNVNVESMLIGVNAHCASITYHDTAKGVKHVRSSNIVKEIVSIKAWGMHLDIKTIKSISLHRY